MNSITQETSTIVLNNVDYLTPEMEEFILKMAASVQEKRALQHTTDMIPQYNQTVKEHFVNTLSSKRRKLNSQLDQFKTELNASEKRVAKIKEKLENIRLQIEQFDNICAAHTLNLEELCKVSKTCLHEFELVKYSITNSRMEKAKKNNTYLPTFCVTDEIENDTPQYELKCKLCGECVSNYRITYDGSFAKYLTSTDILQYNKLLSDL